METLTSATGLVQENGRNNTDEISSAMVNKIKNLDHFFDLNPLIISNSNTEMITIKKLLP